VTWSPHVQAHSLGAADTVSIVSLTPRGGIEGGKEPSPMVFTLTASMAGQGGTDHGVVVVGEGVPFPVARSGGLFR
jgi:hypothetical protein